MACFGLTTCQLRPQFGDEFEELTALHFMRYMEAQGYLARRITLKHSWLPKRSQNEIAIEALDALLLSQRKDELQDLASSAFNEVPENRKLCLVFSQGTPTAQGGDVLALLMDFQNNHAELETIQCKHYVPPVSASECRHWWESLGVALQEDGSSDSEPKFDGNSSAGYSYTGLCAFRDLLQSRLQECNEGMEISIGMRTLAVSFETPTRFDFPMPKEEKCRVWFREMFEPTMSVLSLREAEDQTAS
jgi:hypothetical protein